MKSLADSEFIFPILILFSILHRQIRKSQKNPKKSAAKKKKLFRKRESILSTKKRRKSEGESKKKNQPLLKNIGKEIKLLPNEIVKGKFSCHLLTRVFQKLLTQ